MAAAISSPDAALDGAITDAIVRARAAWPSLPPDDVDFAKFLGARVPADVAAADALATLKLEDLYLAWGCLRGEPAALQAFDRAMAEPIRVALSRLDASEAVKQDAAQLLRERLFVAADGRLPRIAEFAGRGQLQRWVQAAVVRVCIDLLRRHRREVPLDEAALGVSTPQADLELEHLRRLYGPVFQVAFSAAIEQLGERQRAILRHHLVEEMTIDDICARYGVHRTTAFRWIESAREELVELTRNEMMNRLRVEPSDVESILRVIRSEVHLSVQRLLA